MNGNRLELLQGGQEDDLTLVRRLRAGDWSALDELYSRYARQVFQRSWRILRERQAAWDTTQDTFSLFFAHLPCECGRPARDWLFDESARLATRTRSTSEGEQR
jgi:hypothetical protein